MNGHSVVPKYEQTLSVCFVGASTKGGGQGGGAGREGGSLQASPCVLGGVLSLSLWLEKPYLQKHRKKGLLAQQ